MYLPTYLYKFRDTKQGAAISPHKVCILYDIIIVHIVCVCTYYILYISSHLHINSNL